MHTLIGSDQYGQILTLAIPIEKVVGGQGEKVVLGVVRWGDWENESPWGGGMNVVEINLVGGMMRE